MELYKYFVSIALLITSQSCLVGMKRTMKLVPQKMTKICTVPFATTSKGNYGSKTSKKNGIPVSVVEEFHTALKGLRYLEIERNKIYKKRLKSHADDTLDTAIRMQQLEDWYDEITAQNCPCFTSQKDSLYSFINGGFQFHNFKARDIAFILASCALASCERSTKPKKQ